MEQLRIIPARQVIKQTAELCIKANRCLPPDVIAALEKAIGNEPVPRARAILEQLLLNARIAGEKSLPLCQDTGLALFFVEVGEVLRLDKSTLRQAIEQGVRQGYAEGFLRKSVCHPFSRQNTGDNTPAIIHFDLVAGDKLKISFMAKGGGSENMSRAFLLTPAQGWQGVRQALIERIRLAGPNPCPPVIIGLGIGGDLEQAAMLSKKALLRSLDDHNPDPDLATKEEALLKDINALGIGPMGFGGHTTCLGVKIELQPCHIASLPVAVTMQCHSARHGSIII